MKPVEELEITEEDREKARLVFEKNFEPPKTDEEIFYELCFCICAPQTTFKNNIKVIEELKVHDLFNREMSIDILERILKPVRFYHNKAKWVMNAKANFSEVLDMVKSKWVPEVKRVWLKKDVKGLGYKAASHFLRNLGCKDLAIIDTHILKFLKIEGKWNYDDLERRLGDIADSEGLTVAELDIIIWKYYSKTPWENYTY